MTGAGNAKYAAFVGDGHANVFAINAQDGNCSGRRRSIRTSSRASPPASATTTARSSFPVSSSEEFSSGNPGYPCCTSRGSVVALEAGTGRQIWKAWVVPDEPKPYKTMANGVTLYAPAGGAVWNSPTIDPVKRAVYFGTGDATTAPPAKTTDAIMAVDLDTGKLLWSFQATENDVFMGGCNGANVSEACPKPMGPDMDIGNSPILKTLAERQARVDRGNEIGRHLRARSGRQRQAAVPDSPARPAAERQRPRARVHRVGRRGGQPARLLRHRRRRARGSAAGDGRTRVAVHAATARGRRPRRAARRGGDGDSRRRVPGCFGRHACTPSARRTARRFWEYPTAKEFETINRVQPAHGGAISTSGAVVVDGMVYVGSGYAVGSGASGGNVLLAFGVE